MENGIVKFNGETKKNNKRIIFYTITQSWILRKIGKTLLSVALISK